MLSKEKGQQNAKLTRVTPDASLNPAEKPAIQPRSTVGMTTKVVKGSLWTLGGQVLPLFATLASTPFIIRLLGSESYGVLLLVGLIPNYFSFADLGMGIASTKFGSEAYGKGDRKGEAEVVRTAALIALVSTSLVALPLIVFARPVVVALNVPEHLVSDATLALQFTTVSFAVSLFSGIFNTPQLSRLRMDLNAGINSGGRILLAVGTVLALYLGGGLVWAAVVGLIIALLVFIGHLVVSQQLLKELFFGSYDRSLLPKLLRFGSGLLISAIAAILLINLEKVILAKLLSVEALAYYSVAFTFSNMATLFSVAMVQSLIPAFSQMLDPDRKAEFEALFMRVIRLTVLWVLPTFAFLVVIAKPFFTLWAGVDFGAESTLPFYILLLGLFFNLIAYIPHTSLTAHGRTDIFAKAYWIELGPSMLLTIWLVYWLGIPGAAMAWSIRVAVDAVLFIFLAKRLIGIEIKLAGHMLAFSVGVAILLPPVLLTFWGSGGVLALVVLLAVCMLTYVVWMWKRFLEQGERDWLRNKLEPVFRF